ncbi:HAD family hydrolase [Oceanithermus desulfurans]|uniref:Hydrolase n=3 Tax=Oceanithermus TaxID=208447 RepID=A0A511RHW5_9DEIN|nr:HAD-IA family hydrolase [Oceanithermus desulfurans]MBB6029139.1 phosphoglycolate phosphatase [Oceanithermus desulfurans]GEM89223.1 hydrolase [Oceanithermus desulfurans NBRC 100063]
MKPTVVFDLDGTLVDSLADITASFHHVLREAGLPRPTDAEMADLIGRPLAEMFRRVAPAADAEALSEAYRRHYRAHMADRSRPYPGVPELLGELRRRGFALAVATTKRSSTAQKLAEAVGLLPLLDHVQGTDGLPPKPAPDVVLAALAAVNGRGVCMVGDTTHDVLAGKAAGLCTYAVSWGTHPPAVLAGAEPDHLEPDLDRLPRLLATLALR